VEKELEETNWLIFFNRKLSESPFVPQKVIKLPQVEKKKLARANMSAVSLDGEPPRLETRNHDLEGAVKKHDLECEYSQ
jgi:hypothetical protein